ncbi:MAG: dihydropteroate synthase [Asgard group archaeon]|nr:dihydropteroate synthase [Asgard group archaeon]
MIKGNLGKIEVGDGKPIRIVGVVNLSSASFFEESIASSSEEISQKIKSMIEEGVDCLDLGAQSTRPIQIYSGEGRVDADTEIEMIKKSSDIALDITSSYDNIEISIDTTRSIVASYALNKGIRVINDISGLKKDSEMAKVIGDYNGCVVLMAAKNEPGDVYKISDVVEELRISIAKGIENGINEDNIIVDPGIGSWEARDYFHDYSLIKNLEEFRTTEKPIYVGISRKTSIGKILNNAPPEERLFGSIGATIVAVMNGAHIIRTHDVKPTLEAIRVAEKIINFKQ